MAIVNLPPDSFYAESRQATADGVRQRVEAVIAEGLGRGADYFVLGCTELPIAADELKLPYLFADPTYALARAAILYCGYETV